VTRAVVFAYSEVGVRCVRGLLAQGVDIPLLFTHADDPGENQWFGSVRALALAHGLNVVTPDDPNLPEWIAEGRAAAPDFLFSFYYRYLLDAPWLSVARRGALNMHGSLLPAYRGRAPVHWAIIRGETTTGASLHYMLEKPDAGALVDQEAVPILENDTALDVAACRGSSTAAPQPGRWTWRKDRISAGADLAMAVSTGAAAHGPCTTWCARWHPPSRVRLPRSTGVGLPSSRHGSMTRRRGMRTPPPVCTRRMGTGTPTALTGGGCGS
jgi:hypothetical protein